MIREWSRADAADAGLAGVVTVLSATSFFGHGAGVVSIDVSEPGGLLVHIASGLALAWRRRAPFPTAVAIAFLAVLNPSIATLFGAYATAAYVDRRRAFAVIAVLVLAIIPWYNLDVWNASGATSMVLVPALAGLYVSSRRGLTAIRAEQADREQELLFERIRREERDRIAGEMHDVVTHRVSLMVLQAGALQAKAPDETVRSAAADLRAVGVKALEELRDLVGILHSERQIGSAARTGPGPLDVTDLITESRTAGVQVDFVPTGPPLSLIHI